LPSRRIYARSVKTGRLARLPVRLFGSVIGFSCLALAWRLAASEFGLLRWIAEALRLVAISVSLVVILCYAIKCIESPDATYTDNRGRRTRSHLQCWLSQPWSCCWSPCAWSPASPRRTAYL